MNTRYSVPLLRYVLLAVALTGVALIALSASNVLAQEQSLDIPEIPAYMDGVDTEEEFNALSEEQKTDFREIMKARREVLMTSPGFDTLEGAVNCFDYYTFGSVVVDVQSTVNTAAAGTQLTFTGDVTNVNPYPIVDGAVYVKIFRRPVGDGFVQANGYDLVDQFFAAENLVLSASSTAPLTVTWDVPAHAASGEYEAAFYFTSAKKFNLFGLSFTDDITGSRAGFMVDGAEDELPLSFDRNTVTVNEAPYIFASAIPTLSRDEPVVLEAVVENITGEAVEVPVTWSVYHWDAQSQSQLIREDTRLVTVPASGETTVTYTVEDIDYPVYYIVADAAYEDTHSIIDVRFARDDIDRVRLNFPSVLSYPLVGGEESTVFSCAHNTGSSAIVDDADMRLTLTDEEGAIIHQYVYEGGVSGDMMAAQDTFTPEHTYTTFSLTAELLQEGQVVDQATMVYDCTDLAPNNCIVAGATEQAPEERRSDTVLYVLIGALVLVALAILLWFRAGAVRRHPQRGPDQDASESEDAEMKPPRSGAGTALLFVALALGGVLGATEAQAQFNNLPAFAALDSFTGGASGIFVRDTAMPAFGDVSGAYKTSKVDIIPSSQLELYGYFIWEWHWGDMTGYWDHESPRNMALQVQYGAKLTDRVGRTLGDQNVVAVGDTLVVRPKPHERTDIGYYGKGFKTDTPYGNWRNGATPPSTFVCDAEEATAHHVMEVGIQFFEHVAVNPPTHTLRNAGTAQLTCNDSMLICTVDGPGSIDLRVQFEPTYGNIYQRFQHTVNDYGYSTLCQGSNYPLRADPNVGGPTFQVPATAVSWQLTAVAPNLPPEPPTIYGASDGVPPATSGVTNVAVPFTLKAADPDGDDVYYQMQWESEQGPTTRVPGAGWVPSNTAEGLTKTWSTSGTKRYRAQAYDNQGGASAWTEWQTITICGIGMVVGSDGGCSKENQPPSIPTIDGPRGGTVGSSYPFTFVATDPGDMVRYAATWNSDTVAAGFHPVNGYVAESAVQTKPVTWSTPGDKLIRIRAQDDQGLRSPDFGYHTVTICEADEVWDDMAGVCKTATAPTLTVTLDADPTSGTGSVDPDLKATVSGTATGDITYEFYCDETGATPNGTVTSANTTQTYTGCSYSSNTTAKVRVTRDSANADATANITVSAVPTLTVTLDADPTSGTGSVDPDLKATVSGTATGDITYEFYCDETGATPNGTVTSANTTQTYTGCSYSSNTTAKVRVTRDSANADDTANVTVTAAATAVDGVCGTAVDMCTSGLYVDEPDTASEYRWRCRGQNGGTDAPVCTASKSTLVPQ